MGSRQLPLKCANTTTRTEANAHQHVGVTIEERAVEDYQLSKGSIEPSLPRQLNLYQAIRRRNSTARAPILKLSSKHLRSGRLPPSGRPKGTSQRARPRDDLPEAKLSQSTTHLTKTAQEDAEKPVLSEKQVGTACNRLLSGMLTIGVRSLWMWIWGCLE